MRSGLPREKHCFLHGCLFTEKCEECGFEYFRSFDVGTINFQKTGRICDRFECDGALRDTLLDWESPLPEEDWQRAQEECQKSDLCLVLGTSLRIEPVGSLPKLAKKFVIVNKQATPYDHVAALCIRAPVDDVMTFICSELGVDCM
jgi:mono-ADP-ribosyltransferase sirtuin 6